MINLLLKKFLPQFVNPEQTFSPHNQTASTESPIQASDDELREVIDNLPTTYKKMAKKMPDNVLDAVILKHTPYDADTRRRAIDLLKGRNA